MSVLTENKSLLTALKNETVVRENIAAVLEKKSWEEGISNIPILQLDESEDLGVTLESARIFNHKNESYYITYEELCKLSESLEWNVKDCVQAIQNKYSEQGVNENNLFVVLSNKVLESMNESDYTAAVQEIDAMVSDGINLVRL